MQFKCSETWQLTESLETLNRRAFIGHFSQKGTALTLWEKLMVLFSFAQKLVQLLLEGGHCLQSLLQPVFFEQSRSSTASGMKKFPVSNHNETDRGKRLRKLCSTRNRKTMEVVRREVNKGMYKAQVKIIGFFCYQN